MAVDAQGNEVGKLFVGGLHQSTSTDGLHTYFSQFGEIEESIVMMDNRTGRSRGFGYVKFKEPSSVDQVLLERVHVIDNKEVDPKKCNVNMKGKNRRSLKIFVGGIAFEHDEETIRTFFQAFGNVTDVNLLSNPGRPRHRGFAFVGFDDEEVVKKLIKLHYVHLSGKQVEIKPMEPPNIQKSNDFMSLHGPFNISHGAGRPVRGGRMNPLHSHNLPCGTWNQWASGGDTGHFNSSQGPPNHSWNRPLWNSRGSSNAGTSSAIGAHSASPNHGHSGSGSNPVGMHNGMSWDSHIHTIQANSLLPHWGHQHPNPCLPHRRSGGSELHNEQLHASALGPWGPPPSNPYHQHQQQQQSSGGPSICQLDPSSQSAHHQFTSSLNCASGGGNSWTGGDSLQGHGWGTTSGPSGLHGLTGASTGGTTPGSGPSGNGMWPTEQMQTNGSAAMAAITAGTVAGIGQSLSHMDDGLFGSTSATANFCMPSGTSGVSLTGSEWHSGALGVTASAPRNYQQQLGVCKR